MLKKQTLANARLIAAAPELLLAAVELLATHPAAFREAGPIDNRTDNAVRVARAAITKATGGALCPRPANGAPDGLTVAECLARGECGCDEGEAK